MRTQNISFILHVGTMKSGTTFLQQILAQNREPLASQGWLYPSRGINQQRACYGICGQDIPWVRGDDEKASDLATRLISELNDERGERNIILSAEALASLARDGIERFLAEVGRPSKVLFTIRPLDKLIPSAWQQNLKGGGTANLASFVDRLERHRNDFSGPWQTYAYGQSVKRWAEVAGVPVDVVVVPRVTRSPDALWQLFRSACGLPEVPNTEVRKDKANLSLGRGACQILREINAHCVREDWPAETSRRLRKRYLDKAAFPLAGHKQEPILIPPATVEHLRKWNAEEAKMLLENVNELFGDRADLDILEQPDERSSERRRPDTARVAAMQMIQLLR